MALDMHIKFTGGIEIKGSSKHTLHKGEVQILAWSWGSSQSGNFNSGEGGSGAGKANVQDLSITKYLDKASHLLLKGVTTGKHIDSAVLSMSKAGGDQADFLQITLSPVMVTSYSTGGSGGEDMLTENVTLTFGKVKFEHFGQNDKGIVASSGSTTFDLEEVKSS